MLYTPVHASTLGVFRFLFGLVLWVSAGKIHNDAGRWSWHGQQVHQTMFLRFPFAPPPVPVTALPQIAIALRVCSVLVTIGLATRFAAAVFFVAYTACFLTEASLYNNHYYLTVLLCLCFAVADTGRWGSVAHAWRAYLCHGVLDLELPIEHRTIDTIHPYKGVCTGHAFVDRPPHLDAQ